jgi:hypothetical protein
MQEGSGTRRRSALHTRYGTVLNRPWWAVVTVADAQMASTCPLDIHTQRVDREHLVPKIGGQIGFERRKRISCLQEISHQAVGCCSGYSSSVYCNFGLEVSHLSQNGLSDVDISSVAPGRLENLPIPNGTYSSGRAVESPLWGPNPIPWDLSPSIPSLLTKFGGANTRQG